MASGAFCMQSWNPCNHVMLQLTADWLSKLAGALSWDSYWSLSLPGNRQNYFPPSFSRYFEKSALLRNKKKQLTTQANDLWQPKCSYKVVLIFTLAIVGLKVCQISLLYSIRNPRLLKLSRLFHPCLLAVFLHLFWA